MSKCIKYLIIILFENIHFAYITSLTCSTISAGLVNSSKLVADACSVTSILITASTLLALVEVVVVDPAEHIRHLHTQLLQE
jgi:hypothetical protein